MAGGANAALAAALLLTGCGSGSSPGDAGAAKATPAAARRLPPSLLSPNFVGAVTTARNGSQAVQMKFELRQRPDIEQPLDIDLVVLPPPGNPDRISGKAEAGDGLELTDGAELPAVDRPAEGIPIKHTVRVVPKRAGVLLVNATVNIDLAGQTSTQSFAIPIVVGEVPAPATPATPAPQGAPGARPAPPTGGKAPTPPAGAAR